MVKVLELPFTKWPNLRGKKLSRILFLIKSCNVSSVPRLFNYSSEFSIPMLVGRIVRKGCYLANSIIYNFQAILTIFDKMIS